MPSTASGIRRSSTVLPSRFFHVMRIRRFRAGRQASTRLAASKPNGPAMPCPSRRTGSATSCGFPWRSTAKTGSNGWANSFSSRRTTGGHRRKHLRHGFEQWLVTSARDGHRRDRVAVQVRGGDPIQEQHVASVRHESRPAVRDSRRVRFQRGQLHRRAAVRRHPIQAAVGMRRVNDDIVASPRAASRVGHVRDEPRRAAGEVTTTAPARKSRATGRQVTRNGITAPSVPATGVVTNASSERTTMREPEPSAPTNATVRPSGEIAGVCSTAVPGRRVD